MRLNNSLRYKIKSAVNADLTAAKNLQCNNIHELVMMDSYKQLPNEIRRIWDFEQIEKNFMIRRNVVPNCQHYGNDYKPSQAFLDSVQFMKDENIKIRADLDVAFNIDGLESILQSYTTVELLIKDYPRFELYTKVILA